MIVAVQNEEFIKKFKPQAKVLYSTEERIEMLESLKIVDKVIVYNILCPDFLKSVDFDILALGEDHKGDRFDLLEKWCKENNKEVIHLKRTQGICSSSIKENLS